MKTFVMIPTYNEEENIKKLIDAILNLNIKDLEIVVVDDDSPDKTGKIVEDISKDNKEVHLLLRKEKKGRGYAGKAGYIYCLKKGADIIIEMDADFSHHPKHIPELLKEIRNYDIVLGSRRVKGGREEGRSAVRRVITSFANLYIRLILGLKVKDCNSGFRCFRKKVLEEISYSLKSEGPSIVQEVLFKAHLKGFSIKEIPIRFIDRKEGKSKLGIKQLVSGYFMVLKLKFQKIAGDI